MSEKKIRRLTKKDVEEIRKENTGVDISSAVFFTAALIALRKKKTTEIPDHYLDLAKILRVYAKITGRDGITEIEELRARILQTDRKTPFFSPKYNSPSGFTISFHPSLIRDGKVVNLTERFRKYTLNGRNKGLQTQIRRAGRIAHRLM